MDMEDRAKLYDEITKTDAFRRQYEYLEGNSTSGGGVGGVSAHGSIFNPSFNRLDRVVFPTLGDFSGGNDGKTKR